MQVTPLAPHATVSTKVNVVNVHFNYSSRSMDAITATVERTAEKLQQSFTQSHLNLVPGCPVWVHHNVVEFKFDFRVVCIVHQCEFRVR